MTPFTDRQSAEGSAGGLLLNTTIWWMKGNLSMGKAKRGLVSKVGLAPKNREDERLQPAEEGDLVFVKAKFQAEQNKVAFPQRIFTGWVVQTFPNRHYVNVMAANAQEGPTWFKANSVVPFDSTDQTDNIFAYAREDLED